MPTFNKIIDFNDHVFSTESPANYHNSDLPLEEGHFAPDFSLIPTNWFLTSNKKIGFTNISLKDLYQTPLVIVFYSIYWGQQGAELLGKLKDIKEVIESDANMMIVTAEPKRDIQRSLLSKELPFFFYHDQEQQLAGRFGVFSEKRPAWNYFSGIEKNIPLLSVFVVSQSGLITYRHTEYHSALHAGNLLAAFGKERQLKKIA